MTFPLCDLFDVGSAFSSPNQRLVFCQYVAGRPNHFDGRTSYLSKAAIVSLNDKLCTPFQQFLSIIEID